MLRTSLRTSLRRLQSTASFQGAYQVPAIEHIDEFRASGIPGLLSSKGLDNSWYSRAKVYTDNLNRLVEAKQLEINQDLSQLVEQYSKSSVDSEIFNNASLLFNTKFAISSLNSVRTRDGSEPAPPQHADSAALLQTPDIHEEITNLPASPELASWIEYSFGSMLEFKTLLLNSANAINGDGFTWVVAKKPQQIYSLTASGHSNDEYDKLFVVNTYNAGTPNNSLRFGQLRAFSDKIRALEQQVGEELETSSILSLLDARNIAMFSDMELYPVLALDASPKVWLHDYGVHGKAAYLSRAWEAIDWEVVAKRLPKRSRPERV